MRVLSLLSLALFSCARQVSITGSPGAPWTLGEGLGPLRWNMSEGELEKAFPSAYPSAPFHGRNPKTGEKIIIPPAWIITSFVRLDSGVSINATVEREEGRISKVLLSPQQAPDLRPQGGPQVQAVPPDQVLAAARQLASRLDVGPVDESAKSQQWTKHGCSISLMLEWNDFTFEILRPAGAEP